MKALPAEEAPVPAQEADFEETEEEDKWGVKGGLGPEPTQTPHVPPECDGGSAGGLARCWGDPHLVMRCTTRTPNHHLGEVV